MIVSVGQGGISRARDPSTIMLEQLVSFSPGENPEPDVHGLKALDKTWCQQKDSEQGNLDTCYYMNGNYEGSMLGATQSPGDKCRVILRAQRDRSSQICKDKVETMNRVTFCVILGDALLER